MVQEKGEVGGVDHLKAGGKRTRVALSHEQGKSLDPLEKREGRRARWYKTAPEPSTSGQGKK